MTDERNFRSSYYEKVGCRSVEEKKSIEMLFRDKPYDKAKLKQFCLRFNVPTVYRHLMWKILLGILPVYEESHKFVMEQRYSEYKDLSKALRDARVINSSTKPYQMFLMMWLLKTRRAKLDINAQMDTPTLRAMCKVSETLYNISEIEEEKDKDVEVYWILCGFLDQIEKSNNEITRLRENISSTLEGIDKDLHKHLTNIGVLAILPYETWFCSCFASTISDNSISKIWDKIVVGAFKILVFVAVVMLTTIRRTLLRCDNFDKVMGAINNISEETSELIANKAIELWQQSGSGMIS